MLPTTLKFTVSGEPKGKARPRFTKGGHAYTDKKTESYENRVASEFSRNFPDWIPTDQCIYMNITAYFEPPKSMPKKYQRYVDHESLRYPKKVDFDNLEKIICDALNHIAYKDDKQITDSHTIKRYSARLRTEITMILLEDIDE